MTLRFSDLNPVGRAIIITVAALTFGVAAVSFATSYGALYAYVRDTGLYSDRLTRLWPLLLDEAFVRWKVAKQRWKTTFKTAALADSFRSDLLAAARKGEAFDLSTGRPVSMLRASKDMSWYGFACAFADLKRPRVAATTRRTHAEALTAVTTAMLTGTRGNRTTSSSAPR